MKLTDKTVADLLAAFRSPDPTPGGGSASALAGAIGASLLAMVSALPKPKAAADDEIAQLRAAGERCTELAGRLTALVDRDSEAYDTVVQAYRMPKGSDEEKATRAAKIQLALGVAIDAPLDVMRACHEAMGHAAAIGALGNPNASSDVQVGQELLGAGLRGARLNVDINLGSIKDAAYAERVRQEVDRLITPRR
jgi:formiminotetrahydrofolate cyclodeaminase